jgi:chaperonin GroEL
MHVEERLARLAGGVGTIFVGGRNDAEVKSNLFLVEDGIHACFSALRKGVIPAGGVAFKWAIEVGQAYEPADVDGQTAKDIFLAVMQSPLEQLIANALEAGVPGTATFQTIGAMLTRDKNVGYNILTGRFEDFRESFLVEPTVLSVEALRTSFGCGSTLGTVAAALTKPRTTKAS